jgi:tubulin polyglutamylase TTLL5
MHAQFDIRLYVVVTSYEPLRVYLFEDGLVRFATVKFDPAPSNYGNLFMHLTNYSINKLSPHYVACSDTEVEDYGNKWSLSALLQHLTAEGRDVAALMACIEDVIIKTLLAVQEPIVSAVRRHVPHGAQSVCGELYGFDILLDEDLRPWVRECACNAVCVKCSHKRTQAPTHIIKRIPSLTHTIDLTFDMVLVCLK